MIPGAYARFFAVVRPIPDSHFKWRVGLLPVLDDPIDLIFSQFDRKRSTHRSYTGLVFAVVKPDFPSPTGIIGQSNDRVFYALVFHAEWFRVQNGTTPKRLHSKFTCELN